MLLRGQNYYLQKLCGLQPPKRARTKIEEKQNCSPWLKEDVLKVLKISYLIALSNCWSKNGHLKRLCGFWPQKRVHTKKVKKSKVVHHYQRILLCKFCSDWTWWCWDIADLKMFILLFICCFVFYLNHYGIPTEDVLRVFANIWNDLAKIFMI